MTNWTIQNARALFNIPQWGAGYFDINNEGNLVVNPMQNSDQPSIDVFKLLDDIKHSGLSLPCVVRFPHILRNRVENLTEAFKAAIDRNEYQGSYNPVYPIKVNQEHSVVTELLNSNISVGLEAKPAETSRNR